MKKSKQPGENLSTVIHNVFQEGVHRIYAECDPQNTASWKLLEGNETDKLCRESAEENMIIPVDQTNLDQAAIIHSVSWKEAHRAFCSPDFIDMHTPERNCCDLQLTDVRGYSHAVDS